MRILIVSNLYPPDIEGGYERCCAQVATGLLGRGHNVSVLTSVPRCPAPHQTGITRDLHLSDVFDPVLSQPRSAASWSRLSVSALWVDAANVHRLLHEIDNFNPDVVYLWNIIGIGGLSLVLALQQLGMPWVWQLGDPIPGIIAALRGPRFPQLQQLFRHTIEGTYIAVSRHVIEETSRSGVELAGKVEVIPNWVVGEPPRPRPEEPRNRPLRIMMASVATRFKGVDIMMEAARLLRDRGIDDFSVRAYGQVLDASLYETLDGWGIADCFELKGELPQAELMEEYNKHDLFAFPTWGREAFGVAALEAASRGCVVLMTDRCGLAEWLVDGVHCLKAPRTAEGFADAIEGVINGKVDITGIGARAQRAVLRDFHLDAILPRIEGVLTHAVAHRRRKGRPAGDVYRTAILAENMASAIIDEAAVGDPI